MPVRCTSWPTDSAPTPTTSLPRRSAANSGRYDAIWRMPCRVKYARFAFIRSLVSGLRPGGGVMSMPVSAMNAPTPAITSLCASYRAGRTSRPCTSPRAHPRSARRYPRPSARRTRTRASGPRREPRSRATRREPRATLLLLRVSGEHVGDAQRELARGRDVQGLVRTVRVRAGAEDAGDAELGLRKLLAEHLHERDRAAFAHEHGGLAEVGLRAGLERLLEPRRHLGRVPTGVRADIGERDLRAVRRILLEQLLHGGRGLLRVAARRDPDRQLQLRERARHVAGVADRRPAFRAGDREARAPRAVEDQLDVVLRHGLGVAVERELVPDLVADDLRGLLGLRDPGARDLGRERLELDLAGVRVLEPIEQHADHALAAGDDAGAVTGVNALGEQRDLEVADHEAAQRRRRPQLIVVRAARVEADDERELADPALQVIDVRGEVVAARLLARLDQHDAARVRALVLADRVDRGERREDRVAVVGAAATVELVALEHGRPRAEAVAPAGHLGLLVEVAVQHDGVARLAAGARDVHEDDGRALAEADDFHRRAFGQVLLRPAGEQLDRAIDVAVLAPLRIEHRRLVRNLDVVDEGRDDRFLEQLFDPLRGRFGHAHGGDHSRSTNQ